jgi:hypothetical protein
MCCSISAIGNRCPGYPEGDFTPTVGVFWPASGAEPAVEEIFVLPQSLQNSEFMSNCTKVTQKWYTTVTKLGNLTGKLSSIFPLEPARGRWKFAGLDLLREVRSVCKHSVFSFTSIPSSPNSVSPNSVPIDRSFRSRPGWQGSLVFAICTFLAVVLCSCSSLRMSGQAVPAAITSPAPGATLSGSSATFTWSAGTGVSEYLLYVGDTIQGSSNVYAPPTVMTTTSITVNGIPTNGVNLYVTLLSRINGTWQSLYYTYTEAGTIVPAALTSPAPGSTLSGATATFTWSAGPSPTGYIFYLGTTKGNWNVFNSDVLSGTSATVTGIPTTSATLYATLYSKINGVWEPIYYTYTEAGPPAPATILTPAAGSTLSGSTATFTWTPGSQVTEYLLYVGNTIQGSSNVYAPSTVLTTTSITVSGIPTDGVDLYVTLLSKVNGTWESEYYLYTEAGTMIPPALTSPTPGSTLTGSSVTFTWSAGAGPTGYILYLGTSQGSANLYSSGVTTGTSATVTGIPTGSATLYATLLSKTNGVWDHAYYSYTEAAPSAPAVLISPAAGTTLSGSTVTFSWSSGSSVTDYAFYLGTTGTGATNLYSSGGITSTSVTISSIPTTGGPIYATLSSKINGTWTSNYYTFTEASTAPYQVNLSWDAPSDPPVTISGYNVYRATGSSTTYTLLNPSLESATSYSDSSVESGGSYTYYVESVDSSGVASAPSSTYSVTVP